MQYAATKYNDVGWNIFPGNYQRYLTQIIDTSTVNSILNGFPYWRIGDSTTEWYGRFATGFRTIGSLKMDSIFLSVDSKLFSNAGAVNCILHIVYYDTGTTVAPAQSFKVFYDGFTDSAKQVTPAFRTNNTRKWIDRYITINDGYFKHRGAHNSDIMIVNGDGKKEMFALVEILKSQ